MLNLITDVSGVRVGSAHDERVASGTTVVVFDEPSVGAIATPGGAPALRDGALLAPHMTVATVDAFVLSGGSAFGLDASSGALAYLAAQQRGFNYQGKLVPIAPAAALYDLTHGGDKAWGRRSPYGDLGYAATEAASELFGLGTEGAGYGAWTYGLKGGLGSASAKTSAGFVVGALVAVNAAGRATRGSGPHFWAASYERDGEFGGLGEGPAGARRIHPGAQQRSADQHDACRCGDRCGLRQEPAHAGGDHGLGGFRAGAASGLRPRRRRRGVRRQTGRAKLAPSLRDLTEIGALAGECLARSIARAVYEATSLTVMPERPCWREVFGRKAGLWPGSHPELVEG